MKDLYGSSQKLCVIFIYHYILFSMLLCGMGCNGPVLSTDEQLRKFDAAGEIVIPTDSNELITQKIYSGLYRVVPGDVLEFKMPTILSAKSADLSDLTKSVEPFLSRVSETGTITLPIVGEIQVAGMTLTEIESEVIDAYYPKYVVNRPTVVCKVSEHITKKVFTVTGLVKKPGVFDYPSEISYNLMQAIAFAGGIDLVADPQYVTIYRRDAYGDIVSATLKIDRKNMTKVTDTAIRPGDVIAVEMTARERANMILAQVFYIRAGADFDINN